MRCVNPAGFLPKWMHVISMHGLGKKRPESSLFNYFKISGGLMKTRWAQHSEAGAAGFPKRGSSW